MPKRTGFRAASLGADLINESLVEAYNSSDRRHARCEVRNELKWIRQELNKDLPLPCSAWLLLDELIGLTQDQDWRDGQITVWASNEVLATYLDISERQLQFLLRRLRECNFIYFVDSPSRQRWGRRDENGRIVEAYGIDLRPLAQRIPDLIQMAYQARERRNATIRGRRVSRAALARITELILAAERDYAANDNWRPTVWLGFQAQLAKAAAFLEDKRVQLDLLDRALAILRPLEADVKAALREFLTPRSSASNDQTRASKIEDSCEGESQFTHKPTTYTKPPTDESVELSEDSVGGSRGAQSRASSPPASDFELTMTPDRARQHLAKYKVTPTFVAQACPHFLEVLEPLDRPVEWSDLKRAMELNNRVIGAGGHLVRRAWKILGEEASCVAFAIVTERICRGRTSPADAIYRPGGYINWIVDQAERFGSLDLGPKLHGLAQAQKGD
jgi:replication initiation protein RepC